MIWTPFDARALRWTPFDARTAQGDYGVGGATERVCQEPQEGESI